MNVFILTDTESDLTLAWDHDDIIDIEPDPDVNRDGVTVYMIGTVPRQFKGISLEKLKEIANPTNAVMADLLLSQSFTDMQYVNLGVWNPGTH